MQTENLCPSLETSETTAPKVFHRTYRSFQMVNLTAELDRTRDLYESLETRDKFTKVEKLDLCGTYAHFVRHQDTGDVRVMSKKCNLRWCPMCARGKQHYVSHQIVDWVADAKHPKFMTLTLRHSDAPLPHQINSLYDAFRRLRKLRQFNHYVYGGVWFFQIKKSKKDGLWHPHLHCLIDGLYFPQAVLSDLWKQSSHGSTIVDIRPVKDGKRVADYVSRYCARPSLLSEMTLEEGQEVMIALHGRRLCGSWGSAKKLKLGKPKCEEPEKWDNIGNFSTIVGLYDVDPHAKTIYDAWRDRGSVPDWMSFRKTDDVIYERYFEKTKAPPEPYFEGFWENEIL